MKRSAFIAAMSFVVSAPAWAGTYYAYAPVKDSMFAIDPSSITTNGNVRSATLYFVHTTRLAEASDIEVDCTSLTLTNKARKLIRTDLSPVRNLKIVNPVSTPDPKTTGGISVKLICDWPKAPEKSMKLEEANLSGFLTRLSDVLRNRSKSPGMFIDQSSVGDCIFAKVPKDVSFKALTLIQQNRSPGEDQQIRDEINKAATACDVLPGGKNAAVFAALGVYGRYGVMTMIPDKGAKLREDVLAAAWNSADASTREPFLALATLAMSPVSTVTDVTSRRDALVEPGNRLAANADVQAALKKASKRKPEELTPLLRQYFAAMAMGEAAEARLAPQ